jgi:hypothetical protein
MTKSILCRLLAGVSLGVLAFSNLASASTTCTSSFYSQYQSCLSNSASCSPYASPQDFVAAHPGCFPGGSSTSQAQVSASSFTQIGAISASVGARMQSAAGPTAVAAAPVRGMAAGGKNPWNVWANVAQNDTRQAYTIGPNQIKNDLDVTNVVLGADYALASGMVVGLSAAFDRGEGSMQPTALAARSASTTKGWALAPYLGYQINKEFALDASIGFGNGRNSGAGNMESEGDRLFYAANLNYSRWVKDLQFSGKVGFLHGEEDFGLTKVNGVAMANTAAKNKLDRIVLGAQVGYWMGNGAQPYAGLSYMGDRRSSSQGGVDPVGKGAWQWALGVNFFSLSSGINGGVAFTREEGRSNQKSSALTGNVGMRF